MEDKQLIDLYFDRSEEAVAETGKKYSAYIKRVVGGILSDPEDIEETLNDCYLALWNAIPPARPEKLNIFIARIARNIAINRYEKQRAAKRGGGRAEEAIEELEEVLISDKTTEDEFDAAELTRLINSFLADLPKKKRVLFVRRYWYMSSIEEIANAYGLKGNSVKSILKRTRESLRIYLRKAGYEI